MGRHAARKAVDSLEQDVVSRYWRKQYCYLKNRHGAMVKYAKRKINKRERREGRIETDVETHAVRVLRNRDTDDD